MMKVAASYSSFGFAVLACAMPLVAGAQTGVQVDVQTDVQNAGHPAAMAPAVELPLLASMRTVDLATAAGVEYAAPTLDGSSSSSNALVDPVTAERLNLSAAGLGEMQPPPRRRYGRPRYNDNRHNADGSPKFAFIAGAGLTLPVGSVTTKYLNTSYKFQVGAGRNFNKNVSLLAQFDYDRFGLPNLGAQQAYYNSLGFVQQNQDGSYSAVDFSGLDGNAHIWSFTLNPTFNLHQGDTYGVYAVVGGGYYHKVTNFTLPTTGLVYGYYGAYYATFNQNVDHYTSNSAGANGGVGITYKPSRFAGERLYAEARVVHTFNSASTKTAAQYNYYPGNSSTSTWIPITVGVRF